MHLRAVVCSVGRPEELRTSLVAVRGQTRLPNDVLVVAQSWDTATHAVARELADTLVLVERPGLAHAVQVAIDGPGTDACAFVDDDARAHPDWLERIEAHLQDPDVGAVGGRDNVGGDRVAGSPALLVGTIDRWGRIHGNHHLGLGPSRTVHTMKGANMTVRREAAVRSGLGDLVVGPAAQRGNELVLASVIRSRGFKVVYDPAIMVDHFPSMRIVGDDRDNFVRERVAFNVANELTALSISEPFATRALHLGRTVARGTRDNPGLAVAVVSQLAGDSSAWTRFCGTLDGVALFRRMKAERR